METIKLKSPEESKSEANILIIDDEEKLCRQLADQLPKVGCAYTLMNGSEDEACDLLKLPKDNETHQETNPAVDLVIVNINVEGKEGSSLCRNIKRFYPQVPVIIIIDENSERIPETIIDTKADDFICRPFKIIEMLTRIKIILQRDESQNLVNIIHHQSKPQTKQIPFIGDKVDSFVIVDSLGLGKTSLIFKVLDTRDNNFYAMKLLSSSSNHIDEIVQRFEYEIDIMSKIDHPNVIAFHDRGKFNGSTYLVMEYLNGIDLEELLISRGRLKELVVFSVAFDLACAINEIHDKGIIHRDIKLKNSIFIPSTNQVKLCDFGIAQIHNQLQLTQDGFIVGTPIYMAPENFRGQKGTIPSDVYSYGATMYHLATNTPPFVAESYSKLYEQHSDKSPPPIESIRPDFSHLWTELIVNRCLAKEPRERPQCMTDVLTFLLELKKDMAK